MGRETKIESSRCPKCCANIPPEVIRLGRTFECPNCENSVQVKPRYDRGIRVLSYLFGCAAAYGSGLRGMSIVFIGILYGVFFLILFEILVKRLFPPKLQEGDDPFQTLGIRRK